MSEATQFDTAEAMEWYRRNSGNPPFDPHGMCLKICRSARNIVARYPSAFSAAFNTPNEFRIHKVENLRKGHILYFDDLHDSNPFGHITTIRGRVKNADLTDLNDLLVSTNDVVTGKIVIVRATYFAQHWGDPMTFGASWLNGEPFYDMQPKPKPKPPGLKKKITLQRSFDSLDEEIPRMRKVVAANKGNKRIHTALSRDLQRMIKTRNHLREVLKNREGKKK